jgi:hypothetical protein
VRGGGGWRRRRGCERRCERRRAELTWVGGGGRYDTGDQRHGQVEAEAFLDVEDFHAQVVLDRVV